MLTIVPLPRHASPAARPGYSESRHKVDVHDIEVALGTRLLNGTIAADTGVVDQVIDAPRSIEDVLEALADRLAAGDIELGQLDRETTRLGLGQSFPARSIDRTVP